MVSIRLARGGANKRPFYHIVVTDSRDRRDGRHIERLGYYNPQAVANERRIEIKTDRVQYWVSVGARPSPRVQHLLKTYQPEPVPA